MLAICVASAGALSAAAAETAAADATAASDETAAAPLAGWQGMRVIAMEGLPTRMVAADLYKCGRQQIVVANTRQSRLEVYRWLPPEERREALAPDPDRPNELALAVDWDKIEIPLDELPLDVVPHDLDGDGQLELLVLTSPNNRVVAYRREGAEQWQKFLTWDLLPGSASGARPLLLRVRSDGRPELLVSMEQGIQTLLLERGARPAWLAPREARPRLALFLGDLDGDGDQDLIEWTQQATQTVRWYECQGERWLPAQVLYTQPLAGVELLAPKGERASLLLLGGLQEGLVRQQVLAQGEEHALGRREVLPLGSTAAWCGLLLDGQPALVAADANQPRLRVYPLAPQGWLSEESFPGTSNVKALAAPAARPGTLLIWAKDAGDLHVSRWEHGRLSFPQPWVFSPEVSDKQILALGAAGEIVWWAQRVAADLDLFVWRPHESEPQQVRFTGQGTNLESVVWLGEDRLLVKVQFNQGARLLSRVDGQPTLRELPHLSRLDQLSEFQVLVQDRQLRPYRLVDGVLQWLGLDVQPTDQVMLTEGQRLAGYVPIAGGAWALEQGGQFMHRLEPDEAQVLRVVESVRIGGGSTLRGDPVLGLLLVDQDKLTRLSAGRPVELQTVASLDSRVGRPSGVKQATIHRLLVTDVSGDGASDVLLCDDVRHQLTVLAAAGGGLVPKLSWQVFEDQTYPYGGVEENQVAEPRAVLGLDVDGDRRQDLAMLCHDRLLIYLARE